MVEQSYWFLLSLGLVFVIEGFMPAVNPEKWRKVMQKILQVSDKKIRIFGLSSMFFGAIIIAVIHYLFRV
jgi:uncharacterized protein YjeT (DUF2065 family)